MKRTIYGLFVAALLITGSVFANDYYNHSGIPATGSPGSSAQMRAEFAAIETGFSAFPGLTGNANKAVIVNSGGTALTTTTGGLALGGNLTISGAFATTLTVTGTTTLTLPLTGTLSTLAGAETLTNKTFALGSNTFSGTTAEFNTALSDGDFATLAGSETLTTKTIDLTSNTLTGTKAQFNTAMSDDDFATLTGSETLTTKTIDLTSNTLTGTTAQFNTALSDGNFATLAGTETLTNKTYTFPGVQVPSADVNTLDDYEEGTWVPDLGGTATYTGRDGYYTKIGRQVTISGGVAVNVLGTGSTVAISNAPFAHMTTSTSLGAACAVGYFTALSANVVSITPRMVSGSTEISFDSLEAAGTGNSSRAIFGNGTYINFTCTYFTD